MDQFELFSRSADSHAATDAGLDLTAQSNLFGISLAGSDRLRKMMSGAATVESEVKKKIDTDTIVFGRLPSGHTIASNCVDGSLSGGISNTDTGVGVSFDQHKESGPAWTDPESVYTIVAAAREAVRNGVVQVVARLLPLIQKHIATNKSVTGVKEYMNVLVSEAIDGKQCAILRLLLNHGANPCGTFQNKPHLIRAVSADDAELTKDLLHFGADVNALGVNGKTALHVATARSSRDVMELLIDHECDLEARDKIQGSTPLHVACAYCHREAVLTLVERGAEFNAVNDFGDTPLAKLLGPVTKKEDFHNEARLRLAEELVSLGFVLPPRVISKRIGSDEPMNNLKNVRTKKKSKIREGKTHKKYTTPNDSQPRLPESPQHADTGRLIGICSHHPKREHIYRIYDSLIKTLSGSLSLKQLCRLRIIHVLSHVSLKPSVSTLGLPKIVQNYIISGEKTVKPGTSLDAYS